MQVGVEMSCPMSILSWGSGAIAVVLEAWDEEVNLREIGLAACLIGILLTVMIDAGIAIT